MQPTSFSSCSINLDRGWNRNFSASRHRLRMFLRKEFTHTFCPLPFAAFSVTAGCYTRFCPSGARPRADPRD